MEIDDLIAAADAALEGVSPGPWQLKQAYGFVVDRDGEGVMDTRSTTSEDARFITAAPELVQKLRDALQNSEDGRAASESLRQRGSDLAWSRLQRIRELETERDQLQRWKSEALPVIRGLQELGRVLGIRLGTEITGEMAAKVASELVAERDRLHAEVEKLSSLGRTNKWLRDRTDALAEKIQQVQEYADELDNRWEERAASSIGADLLAILNTPVNQQEEPGW